MSEYYDFRSVPKKRITVNVELEENKDVCLKQINKTMVTSFIHSFVGGASVLIDR